MDIKGHGTTSQVRHILKNSKTKRGNAPSVPPETSTYRIPAVFSGLANNEQQATELPTGSRLPWAERRAALIPVDQRLDDTQRRMPIPEITKPADNATEPAKKRRTVPKNVRFNEKIYLLHDCKIDDKFYENASSYQLYEGYEPTIFVISELKQDETSYYRENQFTCTAARPTHLLEDTESSNESPTSKESEEIDEIAPTEGATFTNELESSRVFSRPPTGRETAGRSAWWRADADESKWLALHSRAQGSDEAMQKLLEQSKGDTLLESSERVEIGNQLINLQNIVDETRQFRIKEKRDRNFTDKKANKETRTPVEVYDQLHKTLEEIRNSERPSMSKLAIVLAEFSFSIGSERDKSIADTGRKAIKNIIKTRETLMRKYASKA